MLFRSIRRPIRIHGDDGQTLVEYTVILMLVALVTISVLEALGDAVIPLIEPVVTAL